MKVRERWEYRMGVRGENSSKEAWGKEGVMFYMCVAFGLVLLKERGR